MEDTFLLVGAQAVGKSTTGKALAARFPKSVHIPVDDLRAMVASGLSLPSPEWSRELTEQVTLARGVALHMAHDYVAAGFTAVIDDFWDPPRLVEYEDVADGSALCRVLLYPTRDEAYRRNLVRYGPDDPYRRYIDEGIGITYDLLEPIASGLSDEGWLVLDTTDLSVEETVSAILEHALGSASSLG